MASSARAQDNFYAGKTIRLVVGIDVGSGYDVNARLLARYLGHHIPGKPAIVVQNQPGAGSAIMTSQLYSVGPFDGTAIGAAFAGMPTQPLLQPGDEVDVSQGDAEFGAGRGGEGPAVRFGGVSVEAAFGEQAGSRGFEGGTGEAEAFEAAQAAL